MVAIGPVVSEEVILNCGRTTEPAYNISSPDAFGSGELKMEWGKTVLMKQNHMNFAMFGSFKKMGGWSGGAVALGKLPVPGRPTIG